VRFAHPAFAWLKIIAFLTLQTILAFLLGALTLFLRRTRHPVAGKPASPHVANSKND
jgi:hypothetical protein